MELGLKGKRALVLASSQGLGKAIARQFVLEGVDVIIASRSERKLQAAQKELSGLGGGKAVFRKTDVSNLSDIEALIAFVKEHFGSLDILVNNAGGPPSGSFFTMTDEDWQSAFEQNLLSYVRLIRAAVPLIESAKGGRIINIASSSIKQPIDHLVLSNTFRLGIVGLTKTLATELAPKNILVHTAAPGRIATDRVAHLDEVRSKNLGISLEAVREQSQAEIPLKRYGTPAEFARVVTFLASEACSYMTGSSILIDGGLVKSI